jgi:hypothetical protein
LTNEYERRPSSLRDVQRALWQRWDPIGVNTPTNTGPDDEYDGYAPKVLGLIYRGADDREIAEALLSIEVNGMGLDARPIDTLVAVARQVRADFEDGLSRSAS